MRSLIACSAGVSRQLATSGSEANSESEMSGSKGMERRGFAEDGGTVGGSGFSVVGDDSARENALAEAKVDGAERRDVRSDSGVGSRAVDEGLGVRRDRPRLRFAEFSVVSRAVEESLLDEAWSSESRCADTSIRVGSMGTGGGGMLRLLVWLRWDTTAGSFCFATLATDDSARRDSVPEESSSSISINFRLRLFLLLSFFS